MSAPAASAPRFGVEEEFLLLDAETGLPRDVVREIAAALPDVAVEFEFFQSQIETATPVCDSAAAAVAALRGFREPVAAAAAELGVVLAGTGLPPIGGEVPGTLLATPRYQEIHRTMRGMVTRYYSTGTHVHVEVPSRAAGVDVMNRIAVWSPALVALSANSPIWLGGDSGYASWRYLTTQQWPSSGYPPSFADEHAYVATVDELVRAGALFDRALVNWSVRLSERYPTIELRTADSQLCADDAVAFAVLLRALVARALREGAAGEPTPVRHTDLLRGSHWVAARNGLGSELVHPLTGTPAAAFEVVSALTDHVAADLEASGDREFIDAYIARRQADLGPAQQQRQIWETSGMPGLLELYAAGHHFDA